MKWIISEYENLVLQASDIPKELINKIKDIQKTIPEELENNSVDEEDWIKDGKQKLFHITILYGIEEEDFNDIKDFLKDQKPVSVICNNISYFDNRDEDENLVLKVDCKSKELEKLHNRLKDKFKNKHRDDFSPHLTIAYLNNKMEEKPELDEEYEWKISELEFSMKDGSTESFKLKDKKEGEKTMKWIKSRLNEEKFLKLISKIRRRISDTLETYIGKVRHQGDNEDIKAFFEVEVPKEQISAQVGFENKKESIFVDIIFYEYKENISGLPQEKSKVTNNFSLDNFKIDSKAEDILTWIFEQKDFKL